MLARLLVERRRLCHVHEGRLVARVEARNDLVAGLRALECLLINDDMIIFLSVTDADGDILSLLNQASHARCCDYLALLVV